MVVSMTNKGSRIARQQALRALAYEQEGYFTARQAEALGFANKHFARFAASGTWARERHGIYRLPDVKPQRPGLAELHLWLLWTIGRKGGAEPRGAVAYETALIVYGLSDLQLDLVHLSVPKTFRTMQVPSEVRLHRETLNPIDITRHDGVRIVRPVPTLVALLREGKTSPEHIERALCDGLRSGCVTRADLAATAPGAERQQLQQWERDHS
jgi:predicted transcriptional regulator of viral defense system